MKYNLLFLIIIILLLILVYHKNQVIRKISYIYSDYMYPIKTIKIKSDLTNVNIVQNLKLEIPSLP